ncbi:MAG TPA: RagB/SusD family nutrient uptake outer membrane protein [Bacteroidales bacterium]|nr:RagB/SusD family nutrient uptake outer membrane protein [Bacteroidales bacterium]HPT21772.1 RagB/SusD family nutrient uptake outer membrane protein [Bacteroidales bacterium]
MKKIVYILFILVIAVSCTDFLEEDNKGGISNDDFYSTAAGYETLMTASYATLRTTYGTTDLSGTVASCPWVLLAGTDLYQKTRQNDHLSLYEYSSLYPSDNYVKEFYTNCYQSIQTINTALYYNDAPVNMDAGKRATYKAELRFLRAFYHFLLVEQFGGITINNQITLAPKMDMPRNSLSECYDFIISEIEECIADLGVNTTARVNQDVANHYLAKIYLTRGWDLGDAADFTQAKAYAQKVFDSRGAITLPYKDLWNPSKQNNSEVLFAVQYDVSSIATTTSGNTQQALFGPYMGGSETFQKIMLTQLIPSWNLHMWYAENDARYDASFMLTVYENYFDYYSVSDKSTLKVRAYYPRVWGRDYTTAELNAWKATHTTLSTFKCYPFIENEENYRVDFQKDFYTPTIKKFDSPASRTYGIVNTSSSVTDIVLARLAETYFLYAEACIGLNDFTTAGNYVQKVLDRPGNALSGTLTNNIAGSGSQQEALERYLIESGKEFVGEYNGRWPELRRTGMLEFMVKKYNYDIKKMVGLDFNTYKLRPIPLDAITLNDGIDEGDQNPGYSNN